MLALLQVASGAAPFESWLKYSESIGRSKSDKLDYYLKVLYGLLRDMLLLREGGPAPVNRDIERQLQTLAQRVSFAWLRKAVSKTDDIAMLLRRNIQKTIALDDLILELRALT
jgi:DNA polymerase-3 subunit delta'